MQNKCFASQTYIFDPNLENFKNNLTLKKSYIE